MFFSALCWAAGTVYMKENTFRTGSFVNSAIHFTSSGIVLLIISPLIEDYSQLNSISSASIWSLVYLIVFGSIITYMCYLYAVEHLQVGLVSIYAYINPFIAILLGMFVLQERVTWVTLLAFITTLSGVYFINRGHSLNKKKLAGKGPEGVERLGAA